MYRYIPRNEQIKKAKVETYNFYYKNSDYVILLIELQYIIVILLHAILTHLNLRATYVNSTHANSPLLNFLQRESPYLYYNSIRVSVHQSLYFISSSAFRNIYSFCKSYGGETLIFTNF